MTLTIDPSAALGRGNRKGFEAYRNMKICVVGGGAGPEREGSITSARDVLDSLRRHEIDAEYVDLVELPNFPVQNYDIAFLLTHGPWGEDGRVQGFLETRRVPYTGSRVLGSALSMDKGTTNVVARDIGLRIPDTVTVDPTATEAQVVSAFERVGPDAILRPASGGGSLGVLRPTSAHEIVEHVAQFEAVYSEFLLSTFVPGTDVSLAIADEGGQPICLPPLATFHSGAFYDYAIKHDPSARSHECPARLPAAAVDEMNGLCRRLYRTMRLSGFARFDFIVDQGGVPSFLEVNTIPGMSRQGNLATMARAAGISYDDLVVMHLDLRITNEEMTV